MGSLLSLRTKALLIELLLAIALSSAVIAFSGGITPQSYKNALIVAALVLAPLEALRQTGVLQRLVELLHKRRPQSPRTLPPGGFMRRPTGRAGLKDLPGHPPRNSPTDATEKTDAAGATHASDHEEDLRAKRTETEVARRFAETLAESYRVVYGQAAESGERQRRLAQEFSELVADNLREQIEASRSSVQQLSEQASRQQEAGQELARESVEAYAEFLDEAFSRYRESTERAAESAREASDALADRADALAEASVFSIEGYGEMNVEEVSKRLNDLMDRKIGAT